LGCDPAGTETNVTPIQSVLQSYGHHHYLAHNVLIYFLDGNNLNLFIYCLKINPDFDVLFML